MSAPPTLLLVDGHYYAYRSFFAIRDLTNSKGLATNAVLGFTKALRRMLDDTGCDHALILWDGGLPERRTLLQPDYKAQREEMPADLAAQLDLIQSVAAAAGVRSVTVEGVEADDLMASYAKHMEQSGGEALLATNDKDLFQIVSPGIRIYSTAKADLPPGATFAILGPEEVIKKWGLPPERIREILALTGDSSDNIPGVPGIGTKTAVKWLSTVDSLGTLLEGIESLPPSKVRDAIAAGREQIASNLEMVRLDLDLELPLKPESCAVRPDWEALAGLYAELEFRSLLAEALEKWKGDRQGELFALE